MLERIKPAAQRKRQERARHKAGLVQYKIEASEVELIEALLRSGRVTEEKVLDRAEVELALASVITDWISRWLKLRHSVTAKPSDQW